MPNKPFESTWLYDQITDEFTTFVYDWYEDNGKYRELLTIEDWDGDTVHLPEYTQKIDSADIQEALILNLSSWDPELFKQLLNQFIYQNNRHDLDRYLISANDIGDALDDPEFLKFFESYVEILHLKLTRKMYDNLKDFFSAYMENNPDDVYEYWVQNYSDEDNADYDMLPGGHDYM